MTKQMPEHRPGMHSIREEVKAVRASLDGVMIGPTAGGVPSVLMDKLGWALEELERADDEVARQWGRIETLAEELRHARSQRRVLFQALPVACLITDTFSNVRAINGAGSTLIGPEPDIVGKPLLTRVPRDQRSSAREHVLAAAKGEGSFWDGELLTREEAPPVQVGFTITPMAGDSEDDVLELLWTVRDLSGQRRLEEHNKLLRQRVQHLAVSNQELEEFAHVVAHDLKEPLRGMRLTAGFVEEDAKGKLDGQSLFRLRTIQTLCARAMGMVDSVLEAAKVAGAPMRLEAVRVTDLVAEAMQRLIATITEHRARVECDDAVSSVQVKCDRAQIARAIANLISNGLKYNESAQKRVVISVAPPPSEEHGLGSSQDHRQQDSGTFLQLRVTDNGVGVPTDKTATIFRMFSRLESDGREESGAGGTAVASPPGAEGTGAGLAIVKKIIDKHGGKVWVEPSPGGGTTFCLTLPRG